MQPARDPPEGRVPWKERRGQRGAQHRPGITRATVLLLVMQNKRSERFVEVEQPAGDDDPRMTHANRRWSERCSHQHGHAIQSLIVRAQPGMCERRKH
jgi:hypothetical protein